MRTLFFGLITFLAISTTIRAQSPSRNDPKPDHFHRISADTPGSLQELFRYTGNSLPLVSAHRGGARPGFPENCVSTFENTLKHTFSMLEIDPRYTQDGVIVIHHDATLERTTTGTGQVIDHTLDQLKEIRLTDNHGTKSDDRIPTLDAILEWARGKTILVLDQKDVPLEAKIKKIEEHKAESYAMLIISSIEDAQKCYRLNSNLMMEMIITDRKKFAAFDKSGVPWKNIIAFVGHTPPEDLELLQMIHDKGACCMAGTSRNLDRELVNADESEQKRLRERYRALLQQGVDVIETDMPIEVGAFVAEMTRVPESKRHFFAAPSE